MQHPAPTYLPKRLTNQFACRSSLYRFIQKRAIEKATDESRDISVSLGSDSVLNINEHRVNDLTLLRLTSTGTRLECVSLCSDSVSKGAAKKDRENVVYLQCALTRCCKYKASQLRKHWVKCTRQCSNSGLHPNCSQFIVKKNKGCNLHAKLIGQSIWASVWKTEYCMVKRVAQGCVIP